MAAEMKAAVLLVVLAAAKASAAGSIVSFVVLSYSPLYNDATRVTMIVFGKSK
jgi:capsular polysaccharide biosynthesis protein